MMRMSGGRAGKTIQLAGVWAALTILAASGCIGPDAGDPDTYPTVQDTDSLRTRSAANVPVCHRAERRWVPLALPEAAVQSHVSNHGDFVYDTSAGQCCTDEDCVADQSCRLALGLDNESVIGQCRAPSAGSGTDPRGFLLAVGLFETAGGSLTGTLSRDAAGNYFLSFPLNGTIAQVPLASFLLTEGTPPDENSLTAVTVSFPPRNSGLMTFDYAANYLNLEVTALSFSGDGTVNVDNALVFNFSLEPRDSFVFLEESGDSYAILGIRGVYVQPTLYIGDGTGDAGFYPGLLNGTVTTNLLVFMGAVYDVRL